MNEVQKYVLDKVMNKVAASPVKDKVYGMGSDLLLHMTPAAPFATPAQLGGKLIGYASTPMTDEEHKELDTKGKSAMSLIPGMADYRLAARRRAIAKKLGGGKGLAKPISEEVGHYTPKLLLGLLLGGVGAKLGSTMMENVDTGDKTSNGALKGIGTGLGIAFGGVAAGLGSAAIEGIAGLAAAITKRRSKKDQERYEKSTGATLANYFIPGVADYNKWKNLGYMQGEHNKHVSDEDKNENKNEDKNEEAEQKSSNK